jgi:AraC-like DNA-binding protein
MIHGEGEKQMFLQYEMGDQSFHRSLPLPQTKQTPLLPFAVTSLGDYTCDKRYFTKREGLGECLLLYTVAGEGVVEYRGKWIVLKPCQAVVLDCREYQYYAPRKESWRFLWIHFTGKCAFDYVSLLLSESITPLSLSGKISLQSYYDKLSSCASHFDLSGELEMSAVLHRLLTDLLHLKNSEQFSLKYDRYQLGLEESISFLQKHFNEQISIEQLAQISHLSKYHYIKVFRSYTGQTPYDYLLDFRLLQAKRMLLETGKSVGQVAQDSGFSDSKNFIAYFKKRVGLTPLQFRKQNRLG